MLQPGTQVIVGLGETGLACARYLRERHYPLAVMDTRAVPPGLQALQALDATIPVFLGGFHPSWLLQAARIILSPGIPRETPVLQEAIANGVPVIGDIELFAQTVQGPVAAVTGSNGKSTLVTLLTEMGRDAGGQVSLGGNIGRQALSLLADPLPSYYVLEISSAQLESTESLTTKTAVITNLCQDHLDFHANMQAYLHAKQRIYNRCEIPVINRDEPELWQGLKLPSSTLSFGSTPSSSDCDFSLQNKKGAWCLLRGSEILMPVADIFLPGRHNALNALAGLAMGVALGLPLSSMLETLRHFKGLPHRCQKVRAHQNVVWYNDSKGTNVGATVVALHSIGEITRGKLILIAGGLGKNADFTPLIAPVSQYVRAVVLIGQDAPAIENALQDGVPCHRADTLAAAVHKARQLAQKEDAVLLSPACASFDMFSGYADRGRQFSDLVQQVE